MSAGNKWVIMLVAFDDPELPPRVIKEQISAAEDEHLAAFLRGGELIDVLWENDETVVEEYRRQIERECLR
jgi:hypothetical protein